MELTPRSPRFVHKLTMLQQERQNEKITAEAYQDQLTRLIEEQLKTEVLNSENERRAQLWVQAEKNWKTLAKEREEQRENQRLAQQQEQQRLAKERLAEQQRQAKEISEEEERLRKFEEKRKEDERRESELVMQPFLEYRDTEVPSTMEEMKKRAKTNRGLSNLFQLMIIVTSTLAAGIVNIENVPRLVTSVLTIIVAIVTGVVWIFKFKERSINSQQTADAIEYQRNLYRLGIKEYAGKDPKDAHTIFAEHVEDLKNEQNKRQQLLEQTSDKQIEGGSSKTA